jgi:hypothetical protein
MDKDEYNNDDTQLAQMGHKSELKRNYSLMYVHSKMSSPWISWIMLTGICSQFHAGSCFRHFECTSRDRHFTEA